jgi:hypothetical protein
MSERTNKPTQPDLITQFNGEYRGIEQLRTGKAGKYINEGHADISNDGSILDSEGFTECSALVVQNLKTNEAYLAHINKWDLTEEQYEKLEGLPKGEYSATFVRGERSRVCASSMSEDVTPFLSKANKNKKVKVTDDIVVDSGQNRWAVSYHPEDGKLKVLTRHNLQITEHNLKGK